MRNFLLMILAMTIVATPGWAKASNKKILMMVSEGFYAPEYFVPLKAFEKQGFEVKTAAKTTAPTRPDIRQIIQYPAVEADLTFDQIVVDEYDAIVFAGGNGAWEDFFPNADVHNALVGFMKKDKIVALLCSSTGLLGVANNLDGASPIAKGRKVTGYKRVKGILAKMGEVNYFAGEEGKPFVVVDGKLITGRDPISSELFASTVIKNLLK